MWTDVIGTVAPGEGGKEGEGGEWLVGALVDGDVFVRDAVSLLLVQQCLAGRQDVRLWFERAFASRGAAAAPRGNVLLLGRPRAFFGSALDSAAQALSKRMRGSFLYDRHGGTGDSIAYDRHVFRRIDFEVTPEGYRRTKADYAVLLILTETVHGVRRRFVCIAGVSAFGTLCLTLALANPEHLAALVEQIEDGMPASQRGAEEAYLECCVRVWVDDEAALANLLNDRAFGFQLEVVASGDALYIRPDDIELRLEPATGRARATASVPGGPVVSLTPSRYELLRVLIEQSPRSREQLVALLGFPQETDADRRRAKGRLSKMAHDLNGRLAHLPALLGVHPIVSKRDGDELYYALRGVRGRLVRREKPRGAPRA